MLKKMIQQMKEAGRCSPFFLISNKDVDCSLYESDICGNIVLKQIPKNNIYLMSAKDLINWGELSRILAGSRQTVRKNSIPKKHQPFVSELLQAIDEKLTKLPDTANAGGQRK